MNKPTLPFLRPLSLSSGQGQRLLGALALGLAAVVLVGCKSPPKRDEHSQTDRALPVGPIRVPSGADIRYLKLIEEGRRLRLYAEVRGIDDNSAQKTLLFPPDMARGLNITNAQMQRRFNDTISKSRRFEVMDGSVSPNPEASDLLVEGMVTQVTQELRQIEGGVRVSVTRVRLSVLGKNRYTGEPLFPTSVEVVGQTGGSTGDRVVLRPGERETDPAVQKRLGVDYENALQRAFDEAVKRIVSVIRPLGKVTTADAKEFGMLGGQAHGFQGGDEVVVLRTTTMRFPNGREEFSSTKAVAVGKCEGAQVSFSQCVIIKLSSPDAKVQQGDLVILSDFSATGTRTD